MPDDPAPPPPMPAVVFDTAASDASDSDDPSPPPPSPPSDPPLPTPNPNPPIPTAVPGPLHREPDTTSSPERKRRRLSELNEIRVTRLLTPATGFDDSRRLFQRLFSDEDEIAILKGFLEFVTQRGTTHASYQYETGPFYDQIKAKLKVDFTKNQLVEKLRRLKKKYRTAVARIAAGRSSLAFKSPHDLDAYEISRQIWSPTFKRSRDQRAEAETNNAAVALKTPKPNPTTNPAPGPIDSAGDLDEAEQKPSSGSWKRDRSGPVEVAIEGLGMGNGNRVVEETVRSCLAPLFEELLNCVMLGPGMAGGLRWSPLPPNLIGNGTAAAAMDERWKQQQIMELEVFGKRMELVKEQMEAKLVELKSRRRGGGGVSSSS